MAESKVTIKFRADFSPLLEQLEEFKIALWTAFPPEPGDKTYDAYIEWRDHD